VFIYGHLNPACADYLLGHFFTNDLDSDQITAWSGDGSFLAASLGFYGSADIVVIDVLNETSTVVAQGWNPVWQK
jgi:hypothetical protein